MSEIKTMNVNIESKDLCKVLNTESDADFNMRAIFYNQSKEEIDDKESD